MKKLALLMALVVAVPAFAAVNFTAEDAGNGVLKISYTTTDDTLPRGVALKVEMDNGTLDMAGDTTVNTAFNTFIDYAYSNPMDFNVGDGHPYAKVGEPGALEADAADFVVSMGVLDQDGDDTKGEAGPASANPLILIPLAGEGTANITISADTLRGPASGVVGDAAIDSNLPITVAVVLPGDEEICDGDVNADGQVTTADVSALVSYYLGNRNIFKIAPINLAGYTPAMDATGDSQITTADISKLVSYYLGNRNIFKVIMCPGPGYSD